MTQMLDSGPVRMFRLTNEPGGLGLSCTPAGVSLAGVPLLRRTEAGFVPRPGSEVALLLKAAYGENPTALPSRLGVIAQALNNEDFAKAMIAAVHTRTAELTPEAAARLANAEQELTKYNYNPDEPRDWHGRWTRDGAAGPASLAAPGIEADQRAGPHVEDHSQRVAENTFPTDASALSDAGHAAAAGTPADGNDSQPTSLQQTFERKYDDLGPAEFAEQVIRFGYRLEQQGRNLSPTEKDHALAEYSFLQNRLSLWLNYDYKSAQEHGYLLSAATKLYQGATNSGLVPVGHLPPPMLDVTGTIAVFDNLPPSRLRPAAKPQAEEVPGGLLKPPTDVEFGVIVDRETAGIIWGKGIQDQGIGKGDTGWEKYNASQNPNAKLLRSNATAFDLFEEATGEAISAKTLNTQSMGYIKNPQKIFDKLRTYIDAAVNYQPRRMSDINPAKIETKTIQLAIPEYTSPEQWRYLLRAIIYGKENGVTVVITRIRQ
jgi:hypothetical protein